jgi:hypothetical protein
MKNWSSWVINFIAAAGATGAMVLALNSPALPKGGVAFLIVFAVAMLATNFANAVKSSVLPSVNASAVLKHAEENTPAEGTAMAKAVQVAKEVAVKTAGVFLMACLFAACALFTQVVSVLSAADATLVGCLDDYADAVPANPLTITGASFACASSVEHTVTVLTAELSTPVSDAAAPVEVGTASVFTPKVWVFPASRKHKLQAILADAKAKGLVPAS